MKINAIEVPEGQGPELERRFANRLGAVDGQPGFLGFELLRPVSGDDRYFVVTRWESDEAFRQLDEGRRRARRTPASGPARSASGSSVLEFEVVDLEAIAAETS